MGDRPVPDVPLADTAFDLSGKRALVTGASSGIGAAIASRLANAGARVVGVSRSGTVPNVEGIVAQRADLAEPEQLDSVVDTAMASLGGLDILVNNAGRSNWSKLTDFDRGYFDDMVALNLWAPLRLCAFAHPHLAASGDGAVVMIGSVDSVRPSAGAVAYGATKAGLAAATIALAKEWQRDSIRITQVDPGLVDTPMTEALVAELGSTDSKVNLVGRVGTGDEVAALVHYLVAPAGRFANATSFRVDGGALAMGPFDTWQEG